MIDSSCINRFQIESIEETLKAGLIQMQSDKATEHFNTDKKDFSMINQTIHQSQPDVSSQAICSKNPSQDLLSSPTAEALKSGTIHSANNDVEQIIADLAKLSEVQYQYKRKDSAKRLSISVLILDRLVKQARNELTTQTNNLFPEIDPWHELVDGQDLFNQLMKLISNIMVFSSENEVNAVTLYILHTHFIDQADCSPILFISSPEKRCGKSTLLMILQGLVNRPLSASNITAAALYRSIDKWHPTLILDEADTFMRDNEELRGVINSGHTRATAFVIRCDGDNHEPRPFNTWCPKIIAGIGRLPETNEDRSIIIELRRKKLNEEKKKIRQIPKEEFDILLRKCVRFALDNKESVRAIEPTIPKVLDDRAADNWRPLLAIADLIGAACLKMSTDTAVRICNMRREPLSAGLELLRDIRVIFIKNGTDRIRTADLINALCSDPEAPWGSYEKGFPITPRQLSKLLSEHGIKSRDLRILGTDQIFKGYAAEYFTEAFTRYLPEYSVESATAQRDNVFFEEPHHQRQTSY